MTEREELLLAIKSIMDSEQQPQKQAAGWLKVASLSVGLCCGMIVWMALEVRTATLNNSRDISSLDKRISVVETIIHRTSYEVK